ncbi:hypothetical protein K8R78_00060 [bacterium]|nr:hypothetical protein [bacterium]
MKKSLLISVLVSFIVLFIVGCDGSTRDSYEWALALAEEVRDEELPGATLREVFTGIDESGITTSHWTISFHDGSKPLEVTVWDDGEVFSSFWSVFVDKENSELPVFNNEDVLGWISSADDYIDENSLSYDERSLSVKGNWLSPWFEDTTSIASIQYHGSTSPDGSEVSVMIDAVSGEVLITN